MTSYEKFIEYVEMKNQAGAGGVDEIIAYPMRTVATRMEVPEFGHDLKKAIDWLRELQIKNEFRLSSKPLLYSRQKESGIGTVTYQIGVVYDLEYSGYSGSLSLSGETLTGVISELVCVLEERGRRQGMDIL